MQEARSAAAVALLAATAAVAMQGCGCSEKDLHGDADTDTDAPDGMGDTDGDITSDVSCPTCDDGDPCTVDTCDTGTSTCTNLPYDGDDDGYPGTLAPDGTTACPGTDCDDDDPLAHPGAEEICMDGIDEDCDTIVDGPKAMLSTVNLKTVSEGASPAVAWTGSVFAVAWYEMFDIYLATVGLDGEIAMDPVQVTDLLFSTSPSIAWSGSEIGIAFMDYLSGGCALDDVDCFSDIRFVRVSDTGAAMGTPLVLNDVENSATSPEVLWTGSEYAVVWSDGRDGPCPTYGDCRRKMYFTRVRVGGTEIGSEIRITDLAFEAVVAGYPSMAWTGSEIAVAWRRLDADPIEHHMSRLTPDGTIAGDRTLDHRADGLAWTGSEIGTIWHGDKGSGWEVFLSRADPTGLPVGTDVQVTEEGSEPAYPTLIWSGESYGAAWLDGRDAGCSLLPYEWLGSCHAQIYFNLLDGAGGRLWDDIRITSRDTWKMWPSMAWTGSEFGMAWFEAATEPEEQWSISFDLVSFCE